MFITLEGIDGAGKTTQAKMLAAWLEGRGRKVLLTREPGGTGLGKELRALLLEKTALTLSLEAEIFLYLADRAQHVTELLQPVLGEGTWIIADRYLDSTLAYQGYGMGADFGLLKMVNRWACRGVYPDLTILLDMDPRHGVERRASPPGAEWPRARGEGADRIEERGLEYLARVREGFLALAAGEPDRIKVVEACADPETVHRSILRVIDNWAGGVPA